ncbi:MAG: fumarylacetoacetate hydrolase family protein [Balneolaceae bacterium]|nr:fumarylacetoacetate hydrolase family protein [Balneolaceae bacterium]MBO6546977.1 fumarylacetoacetate hydrolase family protein [Balneolaceae bacterium]MBO6649337.1 fumarylacetoacetate hydrolase family protein [Balneolaceae bacterium]
MKNPTIPGLNIPVHTIFCIGKNYEKHARELGSEPPSSPLVFLKPTTTICFNGDVIDLPEHSRDVHHEVELVLAIGKTGKNIPLERALEYVSGYGIGIDFTARDLQQKAKEKGHPWTISKGFDKFAPISSFIPFDSDSFPDTDLRLTVNGETRQKASTSEMIFNINILISFLSGIFTLEKGDLIFTGTPEGVSAVKAGDELTATLDNDLTSLTVSIAK